MLEIDVTIDEDYDEETNQFSVAQSFKVRLEHSLVSVSKWESVWEEAFLSDKDKTSEQTISYVQMMLLDENVPPEILQKLIEQHLRKIQEYIVARMTATKIADDPTAPKTRDVKTAELIYYLMIELNIPMECQHWHLNRLLTLIRVVNQKNTPKQKMSLKDRRDLNRARRQQFGTRG